MKFCYSLVFVSIFVVVDQAFIRCPFVVATPLTAQPPRKLFVPVHIPPPAPHFPPHRTKFPSFPPTFHPSLPPTFSPHPPTPPPTSRPPYSDAFPPTSLPPTFHPPPPTFPPTYRPPPTLPPTFHPPPVSSPVLSTPFPTLPPSPGPHIVLKPSHFPTVSPAPSSAPKPTIACGPSGSIRIDSTDPYYNLALAWTNSFESVCPRNTLSLVGVTTNDVAVQQLCGYKTDAAVDVAFFGRPISVTEANATDGINLKCLKTTIANRTLIEAPVAVDAVVLITGPSGNAAKCISSLPGGGLTLDQLRWIYSNYTINQLKATGWSPHALPNSDNSDSTHLWSELCSKGTDCSSLCPPNEIVLFGPINSSSDAVSFFLSQILKDPAHGEGLAAKRYRISLETDVVNYVVFILDALGLLGFASFSSTRAFAVSIQQIADSNYYAPCRGTLQNRLYPLTRNVFMGVASNNARLLAEVRPFVKLMFSSTGDSIVTQNGFVPLSNVDKVSSFGLLVGGGSRRLMRQRQLSANIPCGPTGTISATGDPISYALAASGASYYSTYCREDIITATSAISNNVAASRICGGTASRSTVDIALMTRRLSQSEALLLANGYTYKCIKDPYHRQVNEITVATIGTVVRYASIQNGVASSCIESLGGLTVDQLRWIFSSLTAAQLIATGWDPNSIPNSDGNDNTHLWSELGGSKCPATEIRVAGPPATSNTFTLFKTFALSDSTTETIASDRPNGYFTGQDPACPNGYPQGNPDAVLQYVNTNSDSIGLFDFTDDLSTLLNFDVTSRGLSSQDSSAVVPIKNVQGQVIYPNASTLADCTYPLCQPLYAYVNTAFTSFQKTAPWLKFIFTPAGDAVVKSVGLNPILTDMKSDFLNNRLKVVRPPCFSERANVQVRGKGVISIKDLGIGDMVLDAYGEFTTVYSWAHNDPMVEAEFLQIQAFGVEHPLELSSQHMLFVGGKVVPASAVTRGDSLTLAVQRDAVEVRQVTRVVRRGAFAPFTKSGTIAVDGIAASIYVDLQQASGVLVVGGIGTPFTMQFLAHMFQAPHRLLCDVNFKLCQDETYDEYGVSTFVSVPLAAAEWLLMQNTIVMIVVLVPAILLGLVVLTVETLLVNKVMVVVGLASMYVLRLLPNDRKSTSIASRCLKFLFSRNKPAHAQMHQHET